VYFDGCCKWVTKIQITQDASTVMTSLLKRTSKYGFVELLIRGIGKIAKSGY